MSSFKYSIEHIAATVLTGTGNTSTEASTQHGTAHLLTNNKPLRTYNSSDDPNLTDVFVGFDLGVSGLDAIFLDNLNCSTVHIYKPTGGAPSPPTATGHWELHSSYTASKDVRTGRYKLYIDFTSGTAFTDQYIKVFIPSGTVPVVAPLTSVAIGGVTFIGSSDQLNYPSGKSNNISYVINRPTVNKKFMTGVIEHASIGEPTVSLTIPNVDYLIDSQHTTLLDILAHGENLITFFENNGKTQEAYNMRINPTQQQTLQYKVGKVVNTAVHLIEVL